MHSSSRLVFLFVSVVIVALVIFSAEWHTNEVITLPAQIESFSSAKIATTASTRPPHRRFAIVSIMSKISKNGNAFAAQSKSVQFINETIHAAFTNKLLYTAMHHLDCDLIIGGDSSCARNNALHPSFGKFKMVLRLLQRGEYDWILVVDHDAIFAQLSTSIESLLRSRVFARDPHFAVFAQGEGYDETAHSKDMVIARDWNGVNTGSFLVRGRGANWPKIFFQQLVNPPRQCKNAGLFYEQSVLKCLLELPNSAPDRWKIEFADPQHVINAYPAPYHFDHDESKFEFGRDFIAHFAGASGLATINSGKYPIEKAINEFHKICKDSIAQIKPAKIKHAEAEVKMFMENFTFGSEGVFMFVDGKLIYNKRDVC
jgi:hypothetical protein